MGIPKVDISQLLTEPDNPEILENFSHIFYKAFSQIGFIYLTNHGVDSELIKATFNTSKTFFGMSSDNKLQVSSSETTQQGYVRPGMEIFDQSEDGVKVNSYI